MKRTILVAMCVLVFSCTKEADIKLPKAESKLVISSFFCPDDTVMQLKLTLSQPLYTKTGIDPGKPLGNAVVKVSGPSGTQTMVFDPNSGYYRLSTQLMPILPGANYQVQVSSSDGKQVKAETQVPTGVVKITTVTATTIHEANGDSKEFKVSFNDEPGIANFYRLAMSMSQHWMGDTAYNDAGISVLYSDAGHDGVNTIINQRTYSPPDSALSFFDIYLVNCSKAYYLFHQSMNNYTFDDPFSEPSFIYTNVEGGFGVFAAYTKDRFRYKP